MLKWDIRLSGKNDDYSDMAQLLKHEFIPSVFRPIDNAVVG